MANCNQAVRKVILERLGKNISYVTHELKDKTGIESILQTQQK